MNAIDQTPATVLFDGDCSLCNGAVRFITNNAPPGRFTFRPLDPSDAAGGVPRPDAIVLLEHGRRYEASDAVLHIALGLRAPYPLLFAAILIPRHIRDRIYSWIARNRYRWFGQTEVCAIPPPTPPTA